MKIILTKNIFLKLILLFMIIVDILVASNVHLFYLREIFSLIFLLFIPGVLILTSLNFFRNEVSIWCKVLFTLGCSISYLILSGLFINSVFRIMSLQKPLALSFGKPIICPKIGNLKDLPDNIGFFYNPGNDDGLLECMKQAINKKNELEDMGINAFRYVQKNLNWYNIAVKTYEVYKEVL